MSKARGIAHGGHPDGVITFNETTFESNLTVNADMTGTISGPVTIPNLFIHGHLNAVQEINISGNVEISTGASLNLIGWNGNIKIRK